MREPTARRVDGPTPAGGAYSICFYSYDGRPVSPRFANQMTIQEYDANGAVLWTTFGTTTAAESLPTSAPFPEFEVMVPDLQGAAGAAASFGAALGNLQLTPRRRSAEEAGSFVKQAVCLARARVAGGPGESDLSTAMIAAMAVLENRSLDGRWIAVEVGEGYQYLQFNADGSARLAEELPAGVDAQQLISFDYSDHRGYDEQRLRDVVDQLAHSTEEPPVRDAALRLAENALRAGALAQALWDSLREAAHAFAMHFATHDPATIPVQMALEALEDTSVGALRARANLGLDALAAAAAKLIALLGDAMAAVDDAHLRWYYHRYSRLLDTVPDPGTPNLHRVASVLVQLVVKEGFQSAVDDMAREAMADGDALVAQALEVPEIDDFYWLLYRSVVPFYTAEIVYRALAEVDNAPPITRRMVNLLEEKRVRISASLRMEAEQMYTPELATWYRTVQKALAEGGQSAARSAVFELAGHSLFMPTAAAEALTIAGLDPDQVWKDAMADRAPLRSRFAPEPAPS